MQQILESLSWYKPGTPGQDVYKHLGAVSDDEWDALPTEVQIWFNTAKKHDYCALEDFDPYNQELPSVSFMDVGVTYKVITKKGDVLVGTVSVLEADSQYVAMAINDSVRSFSDKNIEKIFLQPKDTEHSEEMAKVEPKQKSAPKGGRQKVSAIQRARELIWRNPTCSEAEIRELLKKEDLSLKTLTEVFNTAHIFLKIDAETK